MSGPGRVRQLAVRSVIRSVSLLPRGPADRVLAGAGLLAGLGEPGRVAVAADWAATQQAPTVRTTLAIFAHRGRIIADSWAPVFERPEELARRVRIEGRAHLDAARGKPVILLGFHLGVPIASWALQASGYPCIRAGNARLQFGGVRRAKPGWFTEAPGGPAAHVKALGFEHQSETQRAATLWQLRALLRQGRMIRLLADGDGRELFRLPIRGRALIVRAGWWQLRTLAGAVVLPVFAHREGAGVVVTVHPPLADRTGVDADDLAACRNQMSPIVDAFAVQHPEQCLPWILVASDR